MLVLVGALSLSLASESALAQDDAGTASCGGPVTRQPVEVTPADGARQVSIDAPVRVQYSAGYFDPTMGPGGDPTQMIVVRRCPSDGCGVPCRWGDEPAGAFVPGRAQVLGDNLFFYPDAEWEPNQAYTGIGKGQDGDLPFSFCTGTLPDTTPPELGPIDRVTSTPVQPRCDAPEGGYRIAVFFAPADDEVGPPASIQYLLYQTRGAGIDAPVLRSTIRNFATDMHTMAFVLPPDEASEVICVRVVAVDGRGNADPSDEDPGDASVDCIDPVQGNYFYPLCTVSAAGAGNAPPIGFAALGATFVALAVRRRRR